MDIRRTNVDDTLATTAADGSGLLDDVELESGKNEQLGLGDILK